LEGEKEGLFFNSNNNDIGRVGEEGKGVCISYGITTVLGRERNNTTSEEKKKGGEERGGKKMS